MGSLHTHNHGKAHSTRPSQVKVPSWVNQDPMEIEELIINKGNPKAWFDPQDKNQLSFGVWDFDEKIVFTSSGCYLNDLRISGAPINALQNCINRWM